MKTENGDELNEAVNFEMSQLKNMDEYQIVLEIKDERDVITSRINTKIMVIWSFFQKYQEKLNEIEVEINKLQDLIYKTKIILKNLNGI